MYTNYYPGKVNLDELAPRIRELQNRQEQLHLKRIDIENQMSDRRVELTDLGTISGSVDDLQGLLKEGSLAERRAFVKSFVKEIRVTGNEAVLSYSIPLLPEKVNITKEGVLPTVQYSGPLCTKGKTPTVSVGGLSGGIGME